MITGKELIAWGFKPGKWFPQAIDAANELAANGADEATIREAVAGFMPPEPLALSEPDGTPLSSISKPKTSTRRPMWRPASRR